ncbi:MAG: aminodeoxychorismate/anthranilate synthase component II [bacterium]|nr:aminodeoxychorismate/anthranilate synthase component II [bacterium]
MLLLLDNYDSFTFNLKDYFEQLGERVMVIKNDALSATELSNLSFDQLVLSPGPKTPDTAGNMMQIIESFHTQLPILGICLGHQALGTYFGAQLVKALKPMHGKVSTITHQGKGIYNTIENPLKVCRYHSLILKKLEPTMLSITAESAEKECMSFQHKDLPITGLQYHPEAILTTNGLQILQNWLQMIH